MRSILLAIQFLTVIPVRLRGNVSDDEIARSAAFFPVAGALQGLILLISAVALSRLLPPDITAGFIVTIAIMTNGGFHLDGLADTFDALAVKSSGNATADREKRLAVMKDSATGAIGVVAVVTLILMKFLLVKNILSFPVSVTAFLVIFLLPVFSKWVMVPAMYHGMPARDDGLGRLLIGNRSMDRVIISTVLAALLFAFILGTAHAKYCGLEGLIFISLLPAGYLLAFTAVGFFTRKFGGITGDTIGALSELSEILYLTGSYIWLQRFI